jgi:hypothetical protein
MHALLLVAALGQFTVEPGFVVVADHHKPKPAASCCKGDYCKCGDLAVKVAALEAELSNLRAKAAKADTPRPAPAATPADRWVPYAADPRYEVLGHDEAGVFRYSQVRAKVAPAGAACPPGALQ